MKMESRSAAMDCRAGPSNDATIGSGPGLTTIFTQMSNAQSPIGHQSPEAKVATMSVGSQSDCASSVDALRAQVKQLKLELAEAKKEAHAYLPLVRFERSLDINYDMCTFYTGFDSSQLNILLSFGAADRIKYFSSSYADGSGDIEMSDTEEHSRTYTQRQELILLLMTLRASLSIPDLAYQFDVTPMFVMDTVVTWIRVLHLRFDTLRKDMFASREIINETLPARFRKFKNIRVIIDCVEIRCGRPKKPSKVGQWDSEILYNFEDDFDHTNYKVLIGCTPNGEISFISDTMEASLPDKDIVARSGLIDLLEDGDLVLADGGFCRDISDDDKNDEASRHNSVECALLEKRIPAFIKNGDCLSPFQVMSTADVRPLHMFPRPIDKRLRDFRIFQSLVPSCMSPLLSQVVFICCCLMTFYKPLEDGSDYEDGSGYDYESELECGSEFDSDMDDEDSC